MVLASGAGTFISDAIGKTINDFVDWAMVIVIIMMIWYVIKFFLVAPPTQEDRDTRRERGEERGREARERRTRAGETAREKKEAADRKRLLNPVRGFVVNAERHSENASDKLRVKTNSSLNSAKSALTTAESNMRSIKRSLRAARMKFTGESRDYVNGLHEYSEAMEDYLANNIRGHLPGDILGADYDSLVSNIRKFIRRYRAMCGLLLNSIDDFIESGAKNRPATPPEVPDGGTGY